MKVQKKVLMKNTLMLYILRFSTYFFGFITVPYQTRIMGNDVYGKIGLAMAIMVYFQLFLDFGFILSATEDVSRNRNDKTKIASILSSVTLIKVIFSVISLIILCVLCSLIPQYGRDFWLYFWFLIGTIVYALLPDFFYRGVEDMGPITYRTLLSKTIFTILIFVFLRSKSDYMWVPILTLLGNLVALLWSYVDLKKRFFINLVKPQLKDVIHDIKTSSVFFLSRIASTIYTTTNTIILGFIDPIGGTVGLYTSAYKLITTGQGALSPISDSVYPYMVKHKDFKLIKRILKWLMPVIIIGAFVIWIFADEICSIIFGKEFADAGDILRAMLPLAVVTLPDYLLGFPTLSAIGLSKHANYSIYVATLVHLINVFIVFRFGVVNAVVLASLTSVAAIVETLYRGIVVWINRDQFN